MASGGINAQAQTGFAKSAAYDEHRPSYPAASVQELLEQCRVAGKQGAKIVDLAAGTGKFTELLVAREEGFEVVAIEPHEGMREVLEKKQLPRTTVLDGKGDSMPIGDASVDAVIVAQAFHWFAEMSSLQEIHRVLGTHGVLGMIWNIEDYNAPKKHKAATAYEQKIHGLTWTFDDNEPRFRHEQWRQVFDNQIKSTPLSLIKAADPLFALPLGEHHERWEVRMSKEKLWERYSTLSQVAIQEGEALEKTRKAFDEAVNLADEQGDLPVHGTTYTVWTSKVPAEGKSEVFSVAHPGA